MERRQQLKEERREVPLSSGSGRGGVSHHVERLKMLNYFSFPFALGGSTEVERLSGRVRCKEIMLGSTVGQETLCFISALEARRSFQG